MERKKNKRNTYAFWCAAISAVLLIISGTTGVSSWLEIEDIIFRYAGYQWIDTLFVFLLVIASLGGFAVFIGGILILRNRIMPGKIFITLGSGAGFLSFAANLFLSIITTNLSIYPYLSVSSIGLLLAITAQLLPKKKKNFSIIKYINRGGKQIFQFFRN